MLRNWLPDHHHLILSSSDMIEGRLLSFFLIVFRGPSWLLILELLPFDSFGKSVPALMKKLGLY